MKNPFFSLLQEDMKHVDVLAHEVIGGALEDSEACKFYVDMETVTASVQEGQGTRGYTSTAHPATQPGQVREALKEMWQKIHKKMEENDDHEYEADVAIKHVTICRCTYNPVTGSSWFEMKWAKNQGILNIVNKDNRCFLWSTLAALHPQITHATRVSHYEPFESELNMDGIEFPVSPDDLVRIEKQNPTIVYSLCARMDQGGE